MNVRQRNELFLQANLEDPSLFPQLREISKMPVVFEPSFGLDRMPEEPGLLMIRGARQLGKSTWLEQNLKRTIQAEGPGSAVYLNGDEILNSDRLAEEIRFYLPFLRSSEKDSTRGVPKIFIDEISAVPGWERAIKRLYDSGDTRHVLIVTTGSKAIDLRRGHERLPGRKGRLKRTNFLYTPVGYQQYKEKCEAILREKIAATGASIPSTDPVLVSYLLTGGSPLAINELIRYGSIPEYVTELTRDWILGECAQQGRSRNILTWVIHSLLERGGTPVSLAKLAQVSGAANNTVIQGYVELLNDVLAMSVSLQIDGNTGAPIPRKSHKHHWTFLLAATAFHPARPRCVEDFLKFSAEEQGWWLEWLVAQELWRRNAIAGAEDPNTQYFWQSKEHELDFKVSSGEWIEVKRGRASSLEFGWFPKVFPKDRLTVICTTPFESPLVRGVTLEDFLMQK